MRLENKICLVTGAGRGIGAAIVDRLLDEGARVLGVDLDAAAMESHGWPTDRFRSAVGDVSVGADVRSAIDAVEEAFGGLDLLVNNAGIAQPKGDLQETDEAGFDRLMAVNVRSVYLFVRYGLPLLERSDDPAIVNIGSIIGLRPRPHLTWYSTSKGAVNAMTQALAIELAGRGIRVNGLCPVATETEMLSQLAGGGGSADLEPLLRSIPLGRFAKPSDVASGVCFLASPDAAFLTGVNIPVDGGRAI